jgi:hypothetical protein
MMVARVERIIVFHLSIGSSRIIIQEMFVLDGVCVEPVFYSISQDQAFCGLPFAEMARVGQGTLVFIEDGRVAIVSNDNDSQAQLGSKAPKLAKSDWRNAIFRLRLLDFLAHHIDVVLGMHVAAKMVLGTA